VEDSDWYDTNEDENGTFIENEVEEEVDYDSDGDLEEDLVKV
jgi:hypothetical protein